MILSYGFVWIAVLCAEVTFVWYWPCLLPALGGETLPGLLKDFAGFFLATQVGILAIVAVAVGIVTFIVQENEGVGATANIRLYYSEGFAYELTQSGVALLLVLIAQLFWPLHPALHLIGWGTNDLVFEVVLTLIHSAWLALNVCLFLYFIITSLNFLDPTARAVMRKRYTASVGIPGDLTDTLFDHFYRNSRDELLSSLDSAREPTIGFHRLHLIADDPTAEVVKEVKKPAILHDLRLRLLAPVIRSWIRRSRSNGRGESLPSLVFPGETGGEDDEKVELVLRDGGAQFRFWDRVLVGLSFDFRDATPKGAPITTPTEFLESLVSSLVSAIERGSFNGFREKLSEVIEYHRFALAALNTVNANGEPMSFAEFGGFWERPDQKWVREYRRAFAAAAQKLDVDPQFSAWLSNSATSLFPRNGSSYSANVLTAIVDLGPHQVVMLEAWVTKHTLQTYDPLAGENLRLAPNDQAAYDHILLQFVGAWESFEQTILISFRLRRLRNEQNSPQWLIFRKAWPVLQAHIRATAFFVASAVWNEDEAGSARFIDMLVRWLNPFYDFLRDDYDYRNRFLLTPDLLKAEWTLVRPVVARLYRYERDAEPAASTSFGLILRGAYEDVLTVAAALVLSWFALERQATDIAARCAVLLLRRQRLDEGNDLTAASGQHRTVFRIVFDFLLRQALRTRFDESYGSSLDSLVQLLSGVASKRMVTGRSYSGWGTEDVASLRATLLAILAAEAPAEGDEGALRIATELLNEGGPLTDADVARSFGYEFEALINILGGEPGATFAQAFSAFRPDGDPHAGHAWVQRLLRSILDSVQADQKARQRAAALDPLRIAETRESITQRLLQDGPDVHVFQAVKIERGDPIDPIQTPRFGVIDRGAFTDPPSSPIGLDEYARVIADMSQQLLARPVWNAFFERARTIVEFDIRTGVRQFWRTVVARKTDVGEEPTILVPYAPLGEGVVLAAHGMPNNDLNEFQVETRAELSGGGGTAYLGTLEGIHVFSAQLKPGSVILFSGRALRRIRYGVVHGENQVADFSFEETDKPTESWVQLSFAQVVEWDESAVIEFTFDAEAARSLNR